MKQRGTMKKIIKNNLMTCCVALVLFVYFCLVFYFSPNHETEKYKVAAKVLSVNQHILQGELIGAFLGSSSGEINNDVNKLGVSFVVLNRLYLVDIKVNHAEMAYFQDSEVLDLMMLKTWYDSNDLNPVSNDYNKEGWYLLIYLNGTYKCAVLQ